MKPEDVRLEMVVQVREDASSDLKMFHPGEKILVKGVIFSGGGWFILADPFKKETSDIGRNININQVEPVKSELEQQINKIKEEVNGK